MPTRFFTVNTTGITFKRHKHNKAYGDKFWL